jgi:hypothetical protein
MNIPGPLVRVRSVEPLEKFLCGEIFEPIRKDLNVFRSVKVIGRTIGWDNGADIDPDVLYYDLKPAWMEENVK